MSRLRGGRASLLGEYPAPVLQLVDAIPAAPPAAPTRWEVGRPTPCYAVDYKFAHTAGRRPLCWPATVELRARLCGPAPEGADTLLRVACAEIRTEVNLPLTVADTLHDPTQASKVVAGELRLAFVSPTVCKPAAESRRAPGLPPRPFCSRGTLLDHHGRELAGGWAAVSVYDVNGPYRDGPSSERTRIEALPERGIGLVRHMLGHALGLEHPARKDTLMHNAVEATRWTASDLAGLRLLAGR